MIRDIQTAETAGSRSQRANRFLLVASVVLLPATSMSFARGIRGFGIFFLTGVVLLGVLVTADWSRLGHRSGWSASAVMYFVLAAFGVLSYAFHRSVEGLILVVALVLLTGLVVSIAALSIGDAGRLVALPLLATASFQAIVITIQSVTGSAAVLTLLHPGSTLFISTGGLSRPQGTYEHVYEAAGVALLAIGLGLAVLPSQGRLRTLFLVGLGAAASTVALTHSRAALLGLILVVVIGGIASIRGDKNLRLGIGVVLIAFIIPAMATASGWQTRIDDSAGTDLDSASAGRITLARQAIVMAGDYPVIGVGIGRYMEVLEAEYMPDPDHPFIVHNISLAAAAELGIVAGIVFTAALVWAGVQALAGGGRYQLLYAAPIPFLMLDILLYNRPVGLFLFALWCGACAALYRDRTHTSEAQLSTVDAT